MIESIKHLSIRNGKARMTQHFKLLTHNDRPKRIGKNIRCPNCSFIHRVKSFAFDLKICPSCGSSIRKEEWLLDQINKRMAVLY